MIYFARLKTGHPNPPADRPDVPGCWKLYTVCADCNVVTSLARKDIAQLNDVSDRNDARTSLIAIENRANTGMPLSTLYDETRCHEAHSFFCQSLGGEVKILRIWGAGKIRVYFSYLPEKCILILKIASKRINKLTKGQEKELENIVEDVYKCLSDYDFSERLV